MLFISPKKLLLFCRYLHFCSDCFGHVGKQLDKKKLKLILRLMMSQTGKHIFTIQIMLNISRSKDNQTMIRILYYE